jgi:hypothetical protein
MLKGECSMPPDQMNKIVSRSHAIKDRLKNLKFLNGSKIGLAVILLLVIGFNLFFIYVEPDEYGIKVNRVGLNRGVQKMCIMPACPLFSPSACSRCTKFPREFRCWS